MHLSRQGVSRHAVRVTYVADQPAMLNEETVANFIDYHTALTGAGFEVDFAVGR